MFVYVIQNNLLCRQHLYWGGGAHWDWFIYFWLHIIVLFPLQRPQPASYQLADWSGICDITEPWLRHRYRQLANGMETHVCECKR